MWPVEKGFLEWRPRRKKEKGGIGDTVRTLVYAILIAVAIRTVAYEPFNIPSGSMRPTLLVGDYLFVSKFSYGYSKYSLPFSLPLFSGRIIGRAPERGDVVVFKTPADNATDFIKRVIGVPGDRVQVRGGVVFVNDQAIERQRIEDFLLEGRKRQRRANPAVFGNDAEQRAILDAR